MVSIVWEKTGVATVSKPARIVVTGIVLKFTGSLVLDYTKLKPNTSTKQIFTV
jgi:hypothetical protein